MSKNITPGVPGQDPTSIENTNPATEADLIEEVTETLAAVDKAMPRVERAAHYREMMSGLRRAVAAAKLLGPLPEDEAPVEPEPEEEDEGPITERRPSSGGSLAMLSNGRVALSLAYLEGADLEGYETWTGIVLSAEQAETVLEGLGDAADDVAGNIGGAIVWKKKDGGSDE